MSMFNDLTRKGRLWGFARLIIALLILLLLIQFGRLIFERIDTSAVLAGWRADENYLRNLPRLLQSLIAFLFSGVFFRFIYFPIAAFIGAILLLALYLHVTYELPRFRLALRFVIASLFGIGYPILKVENGKTILDPNKTNLLNLKGGSGIVQVSDASVVLIENLNKPTRVLSTGIHFIDQTELIKHVNSLEDHHGFIDRVPATTKDGIPIQVRDIRFRFRVLIKSKPNESQPYPYMDQAVRDIAYNRIVTSLGLNTWHASVQVAVQAVITDYVASHRIDDLTTALVTDEPNARVRIRNRLFSESSRDRFNILGTDLIWVDIGHFDILDKDERDPRPRKWGEEWDGLSKTKRALGEGEKLYYQELGRAEAQSEILISILESLRNASISKDPRENIKKIILMRTAQVLEAMTEKKPKLDMPENVRRSRRRPRRRKRR